MRSSAAAVAIMMRIDAGPAVPAAPPVARHGVKRPPSGACIQPLVAKSAPPVDLDATALKCRFCRADGRPMPLSVPPRRLFAAAAAPLLAAAAFGTPTASYAASPPCAATTVAAGQAPAATVATAVRCLVNAQRAAHGLAPLKPSRQLR